MSAPLTAAGSAPNSAVNLQGCNGSPGQAWEITGSSGHYQLHLDVLYGGTSDGTPVLVYTCTGNSNQSWAIN